MGRKPRRRYVRSDGYVILSGGRHGAYEHRAKVAAKIGRRLRRSEMVHHKNGNRSDNRLRNLEVVTVGQHNRLHFEKKEQHPCGHCGKVLTVQPYRMRYSKSGRVFCDNHCSGMANNGGGLRGRPFSEKEILRLVELRGAGLNYNQIAKKLRRNRESIRTKLIALHERE